jgi:tetratricopeptide (TPR) repeat protein
MAKEVQETVDTQSDLNAKKNAPSGAKAIFVSYAHVDNEDPDPKKRWLDRLRQFLAPLVRQGDLRVTSDLDIKPGEDWQAKIERDLNDAFAAVLLVSPAYLASDYVSNSELPVLLRNAKGRGVRIIPVIVKRCLFKETRFKYPHPRNGPEEFTLASFQAANPPTKPLSALTEDEQDQVLHNVSQSLINLASENTPTSSSLPADTSSAGSAQTASEPPKYEQSGAPPKTFKGSPHEGSPENGPTAGGETSQRWQDWKRRISRGLQHGSAQPIITRFVILVAILGVVLVAVWGTRNLLFQRKLPHIVDDFVDQRITAKLNEYYTKTTVDDKKLDTEILGTLETKYGLASGTLTHEYFTGIEQSAVELTANPQPRPGYLAARSSQLLNSLTYRYRFREAEQLALALASEEEKQTFPKDRAICEFYNTAGWMALCQDGYPGQFAQWLAVSKEQYQRAEEYFDKADNSAQKIEDRGFRAGPEYGIAMVRFRTGHCAEAKSLIQESVKARLNKPGDERNTSNLDASALLGQVLLECGDKAEGEKELKRVYNTRMDIERQEQGIKVIAPKNIFTILSWCDWGNALRAQGNPMAEKVHEEAFDRCKSETTPEALPRLYCQYNLAQTLSEVGRNHEAEVEFREVISVLEARYDPKTPHGLKNRLTLDVCYQFARHLAKTKQVNEATTFAKDASDGRRALLGEQHPDTMQAEKLLKELQSRKMPL